jgi:hypothetical protein
MASAAAERERTRRVWDQLPFLKDLLRADQQRERRKPNQAVALGSPFRRMLRTRYPRARPDVSPRCRDFYLIVAR